MRTFMVLYVLGLNICQAAGEVNSTQMYYVKLTIDENAIENITEKLLTPFVSDTNLNVGNLEVTTKCQSSRGGTKCDCEPGFTWSDKVCSKFEKCCESKKCIFPSNSAHMCVSNETVTVSGSIFLNRLEDYDCLEEKYTDKFKKCNNKLLQQMKTVYSTLTGFDMLTIHKYRRGSVIAEFEMSIAFFFQQRDFIEITSRLSNDLSGSIVLKSSGVVRIRMPAKRPVCDHDQPNIRCILREDLKTQPEWHLNREGIVYKIFNGTESKVTSAPLGTNVTLISVSELWAGEYTCAYHQDFDFVNITHKASAVLDIDVLPNIDITTEPEFPRCRNGSDSLISSHRSSSISAGGHWGRDFIPAGTEQTWGSLIVRVKCETGSDTKNYNVTWSYKNAEGLSDGGKGDYAAYAKVSCNNLNGIPQLSCTFKNKCNQKRTASTYVNIIHVNDQFCAAEGDWKDTKAGFTAVLKCTNEVGRRTRKCNLGSTQATWEPEVSACVNQDVNKALERANIVAIGRGSTDENAAGVFSLLKGVTNNSQAINTYSNMNASVEVLSSLRQKLNSINNQSTTNDFLESSSNLLDRSLNESWTTTTPADDGNISLAERYLDTVEHLIQMTDVSHAPKTKNIEVATSSCTQRSQCGNTVFNVTVVLDSEAPGSVKTAGFKELENYLPNDDDAYEPNSIVVATTTDKKRSSTMEVKIDFELIKPRPRNVRIKCVSWDNSTRGWSTEGCEWVGASQEGLCVCRHLSTFAILMSRYPVHVEGLNEMTYVGLSVSIVSLVISLVVEVVAWSSVVKTNTLYLRHTAHINIALCLLVADCLFLASSSPGDISEMWCKISVVLKHFCFLSMFFWMLSLSSILLHQAVFLFHSVSKKTYLRLSLTLGYVCPLLIVVGTFLAYKGGAEGVYFSNETCWLHYTGFMEGSIHTFVIPVGVIVFFNVFSMLVVIMKLLDVHTEKSKEKERKAAITVMRSVILLTPIFGVTWVFGFAVMLLDLTSGPMAIFVNYVFTLLNAFQGLFILLTTCLGDKLTREALKNRLWKRAPASTTDSTTKLESSLIN